MLEEGGGAERTLGGEASKAREERARRMGGQGSMSRLGVKRVEEECMAGRLMLISMYR